MVSTYRVTVYRPRIVSIIQTGDGDRWTRDKAKQIENRARILAPKRTGRLAASHVTLPTTGSNQYQKVYRVSAMAPYGAFVHGGTGVYGPRGMEIVAPTGMAIPAGGGRRARVIYSSRGQRANPWLERAADQVLGLG